VKNPKAPGVLRFEEGRKLTPARTLSPSVPP
jgi:hypothetical protein